MEMSTIKELQLCYLSKDRAPRKVLNEHDFKLWRMQLENWVWSIEKTRIRTPDGGIVDVRTSFNGTLVEGNFFHTRTSTDSWKSDRLVGLYKTLAITLHEHQKLCEFLALYGEEKLESLEEALKVYA